ncbi:MAG TPA: hypothetical protein VGK67_11020 [Myxococcales bacterium]
MADPRCPVHPENLANGMCNRCGRFVCSACRHLGVDEKGYCDACLHHPDCDPVERFRRRMWGSRDLWTWLVGALGAGCALGCGYLAARNGIPASGRALAALLTVYAAACLSFFFRARPARWGLPAASGLGTLALLVASMAEDAATRRLATGAVVFSLTPLLASLALFGSVRNRLFFRLEVPRPELERAWRSWSENSIAMGGLLLGVCGLAVPFCGLAALYCGVAGQLRTRLAGESVPRAGVSKAAIVLGLLGCAWTAAMFSSGFTP